MRSLIRVCRFLSLFFLSLADGYNLHPENATGVLAGLGPFASLVSRVGSAAPNGVGDVCWDHMMALQEITSPLLPRFNKADAWAWKSECMSREFV